MGTYFIDVNLREGEGGLQKLTKVDKGEKESPKVDINYGNFVNLISFGFRKVKRVINCDFQYMYYT